jgi:hypothetical protein
MREVLRIAWYRFRVTLRRRWGGYVSVVLLIGLLGGVALASIAGGRRTQSSYPTFFTSTNPSNLTISAYFPNSGGNTTGTAKFTSEMTHLADVRRVRTLLAPNIFPLGITGAPRLTTSGNLVTAGSLDGLLLNQDRVTVVEGRRADPKRANEVMVTANEAQQLGVHLGQVVPLGFYTNAQTNERAFGTPALSPRLRVDARLVGIIVLNDDVVQDDIDQAYGFLVVTPEFLREVVSVSPAAAQPVLYGLQLRRGDQDVVRVEKSLTDILPPGSTYNFHITSRVVSAVELSVKPESVALGAFGAIAAVVALVLAAQAISRQLRIGDGDRRVMRALGASPTVTVGEGLVGALIAVALGSVLAAAVAVVLSPLAPLGPVRPVYPDGGISFDWMVLGLGLATLFVGLGAAAVVMSIRGAPSRAERRRRAPMRSSSIARAGEAAGMPVAGVMGVRFALDSPRGRTAVPLRSALLGTVVAVAVVVATLTFASGLNTLVSHPSLYGWNWTYMLNSSNDVPPQTVASLDHDPDVAAWADANLANAQIDGQSFPILLSSTKAELSPPILSGHGLNAEGQIVLGAATMAVLDKHVGDTVLVSYGTPEDAPVYVPPTRLRIVGTATLPTVGYTGFIADHTSMGTGAIVPMGIEPPAFQRVLHSPDQNLNGPQMVFVRLQRGIGAAAGREDMQRLARSANKLFAADPNGQGNTVAVLGVQRPAQIVNYRSVGSTPVILAVGLAVGAVVALGLTLAASVRQRRRDLALLKTLGFIQRQLAAAITWQAMVAAVFGVIIGVPLGIVIGRQLWIVFARNINAVPDPTVPSLSVLVVAIGTLVFASLVSTLPGRRAARTSTTLVLRAE